jgi:hypothetical protein
MGVQVAATLDNELKPSYTVATTAAAAFVLADSDMAIWVGNATPFTKIETVSALKSCLEYIRENDSETPTGTNESYAELGTNFKKDVNGAFDAAAVIPEEAKVGIWYGPDFQAVAGSSLTPFVIQAIEKYLETTQKSTD